MERRTSLSIGANYIDAGATAVDSFEGDLTDNIVKTGTVDTAKVGTYILSYNVSDAAGNAAAEVTRTVTVSDMQAPVITLIGSADQAIEVGSIFTDAGATAIDSYEGELTDKIVKTGTVDTAKVGTYTVSYNVSDAAGNTAAEVTRTVSVSDTQAPVITLIGSADQTIEVGSIFSDAGATALDDIDGDLGTYTVSYNSDTTGNAAADNSKLSVSDTQAPVITLIGSADQTIEVGSIFTDAGAPHLIVRGRPHRQNSENIVDTEEDATGNPSVELIASVSVSDSKITVT